MKQFLKRIQNLALATGLVFSTAVAMVPHASAATSLAAAPRVTLTFDDGLTSAIDLAAPTLQKYGISATNFVITGCVGMTTAPNSCASDPEKTYMTWDQIKTLKDTYGWNIGSHTVNHPYLASTGGGEQELLTAQQIHDELANSKAALADQGIDAIDFAAPYGDYNNTVLAEAAKYYATFRGFADIGFNVWPYNDRLVVNQQVQTGVSVDTVKGYVDQAIANNQWLVLTFHDIVSSVNSDEYHYLNSDLDQIAAYVKSKVDARNITVASPHDAIVNGTVNMLGDGSFDTAMLSTDWQNRNTAALVNSWVTDDTTGLLIKKDTGTNGSYVIGNASSPVNSLYISAAAANAHIWAPRVAVNSNTTYTVKGYFNITNFTPGTAATPEVAFYVDEYDANGLIISNQYSPAVRYDANVNAIRVRNANFAYKPTSASVAYARVYVSVQGGGGITGYMDNIEMLDPNTATTGKIGDIDGNGVVNNDDATILFANWGTAPQAGDLNNNGVVDNDDATILFANWSK